MSPDVVRLHKSCLLEEEERLVVELPGLQGVPHVVVQLRILWGQPSTITIGIGTFVYTSKRVRSNCFNKCITSLELIQKIRYNSII